MSKPEQRLITTDLLQTAVNKLAELPYKEVGELVNLLRGVPVYVEPIDDGKPTPTGNPDWEPSDE